MASVNKIIIVGGLGRDPEVRSTPGGKTVAKFPVGTSDTWTDQSGKKQERTEWFNVVVWGNQANACGQYLTKGRQVYVEGAMRTRSYDDKDGNKRFTSEVVAERVQFLGGNQQRQNDGQGDLNGFSDSSPQQGKGGGFSGADPDDDVPFITDSFTSELPESLTKRVI